MVIGSFALGSVARQHTAMDNMLEKLCLPHGKEK